MKISSIVQGVATCVVFWLSCFVGTATCSSGKVIDLEGNTLVELRALSSKMAAVQFTNTAKGEFVTPTFSYVAEILKNTPIDFAQVDLSSPLNAEWSIPEGIKYVHIVPTTTGSGFQVTLLDDMPETPMEMAHYIGDQYILTLFNSDLVNFGIERARELHLPDLDGIAIGLDLEARENTKSNNDISSTEDAVALHTKATTTEKPPFQTDINDEHGTEASDARDEDSFEEDTDHLSNGAGELHVSDHEGIPIGLDFDDSIDTKFNNDMDSDKDTEALDNKIPTTEKPLFQDGTNGGDDTRAGDARDEDPVQEDTDHLGNGATSADLSNAVEATADATVGASCLKDTNDGHGNISSASKGVRKDSPGGTTSHNDENLKMNREQKYKPITTVPFSAHRHHQRHSIKTSSLQVGEVLTRPEVLASADRSTTLALTEDASIVIRQFGACPENGDTNPMVPPPTPQCPAPPAVDVEDKIHKKAKEWKLLSANRRLLRRMAKKKNAWKKESHRRRNAKDGTTGKKGPLHRVRRFFGRGGTAKSDNKAVPGNEGTGNGYFRRWFGRKNQNGAGLGDMRSDELTMSVSNTGGVEVTCDGVKLISKSGPYRWEWVNRASRLPRGRKRSDKYELRVAVDGFDVRLGQEKVWGMALPPSFPEPEKT